MCENTIIKKKIILNSQSNTICYYYFFFTKVTSSYTISLPSHENKNIYYAREIIYCDESFMVMQSNFFSQKNVESIKQCYISNGLKI